MLSFTLTLGALAVEGKAELQSLPFTDVAPGAWYFEAVQYAHTTGLMTGTSPTIFAPHATLNRAMLATILWRMEGEPAVTFRSVFADVPAGQWFSSAVIWAFDNDIVTGTSPTTFEPNANITREQFATMMHRYASFAGEDVSVPANFNLNNFADQGSVSSWAATAMRWAVYTGLISGTDAVTLAPRGNATRAQAAIILMRFLEGVDDIPEPPIQQTIDIRNFIGMTYNQIVAQYGHLLGTFSSEDRMGVTEAWGVLFYDVGLVLAFDVHVPHPLFPDDGGNLNWATIGRVVGVWLVSEVETLTEEDLIISPVAMPDVLHINDIFLASTMSNVRQAFGTPSFEYSFTHEGQHITLYEFEFASTRAFFDFVAGEIYVIGYFLQGH